MLGRITTRALSTGARQVIPSPSLSKKNEHCVHTLLLRGGMYWLCIPNLYMTMNQKVEEVFIVSAARTPLGSMEGSLKVGSSGQDDVMMINISFMT